MKNDDIEKLRAFEEWLSDEGRKDSERRKAESAGTISVLVRSGEWWRVFTTESFSIRTIVVHLTRYCPDYRIMAAKYGEYKLKKVSNQSWTRLSDDDVDGLGLRFFGETAQHKEAYIWLQDSYRDAVNLWYIHCANSRLYPGKRPFTGVRVPTIPEYAAYTYGTRVERPFFVSDKESIYKVPSDINLHYEAKRVDRTVRGESVSGYLVTACRLENKRKNAVTNGI